MILTLVDAEKFDYSIEAHLWNLNQLKINYIYAFRFFTFKKGI
jgi:hypothetical protein